MLRSFGDVFANSHQSRVDFVANRLLILRALSQFFVLHKGKKCEGVQLSKLLFYHGIYVQNDSSPSSRSCPKCTRRIVTACINTLSEKKQGSQRNKTRKPGEAEFIVKGSVNEKTSKELSKRRAKRFRGWFISCFKTPREERGRSSR